MGLQRTRRPGVRRSRFAQASSSTTLKRGHPATFAIRKRTSAGAQISGESSVRATMPATMITMWLRIRGWLVRTRP